MMKYKFNTHYMVTKGNSDGSILLGDRMLLQYKKNKSEFSNLGEYIIILPPRKTQKNLFGMPPMNNVIYFEGISKMNEALDGVEVEYDFKLVNELISIHQTKIDKLKKNHELI